MRTKISKDPRKIPAKSDHKICVSMPKVVLDANDCAKLLEGSGKTSVVVMERDGKLVAVTRPSSPSSLSSTSTSTISSTSPSTSSSLKSPVTTSWTKLSESAPAKSSQETSDSVKVSSASLSKISSSLLQNNGQVETVEHKETPVTTPSNHVQDSISADQGKMILKPPKKRRVNDAGLYEDSSSVTLVNGDQSGHGVIASTPGSLPVIGEAREAVALRSIPALTLNSTSSSLQKHTIENLLQTSHSHNGTNSNNKNNNNSNTSSNMNYISGLPFPSHPTYAPTSVIHPPIYPPAGSSHDLCSTTTAIPQPPPTSAFRVSSPLSSHQPSAFSSLSSHTATTAGMIPPSPSHDSSSHIDPNPTITYNHHHDHSVLSKLPSHTSVTLPVPVAPDKCPRDDINQSSSSTLSQSSPTPDRCHPPYRTSPEQNEPINLSTTFSKPHAMSKESELSSNDHRSVTDNHELPEGCSQLEIESEIVWENSCSNDDHVIGQSKLESSCVESTLNDKTVVTYNSAEGLINIKEVKMALSQQEKTSTLKLCENSSNNNEAETQECSSATSLVTESVENSMEKNSITHSSQPSCDLSVVEGEGSTRVNPSSPTSLSSFNPSLKDVSPAAEGSVPAKKSKKSTKKRLEIPMDEESCAMRSTSYCESIDHVIQHFEYVAKSVDGEIELTEEEEAILRQQFDDGGSGDKSSLNDKDEKTLGVHNENEVDIPCGQEEALCTKLSPAVKGKSKGKLKPKKQRVEKLSPTVQNVIDILSFVAANVCDETFPCESGLLELEVFLKSLRTKCEKRLLLLDSDNVGSDDKLEDAKSQLMAKKAKKTLSDISLFYPSDEDLIDNESKQLENVNNSKDDSHLDNLGNDKVLHKSKKSTKRKSESKSGLSTSEAENCDSDLNSSAGRKDNSMPKQKKAKKNSPASKVKKEILKQSLLNVNKPGDLNGETGFKGETSDIGESIASTSGGSDEQMTPVHDPDPKDEGVNTDVDGDVTQDADDVGDKPVRHYKKRLDFVKCSQCDHQCRGRSALSRHMKKVHLVEADMPYRCHLCTYGCTKMGSLNRHLSTHNVFVCTRCDYRTDERDKLTEHVAEKHKDKLDMKLCKVCSRYIKCDGFTIEDHTNSCQGPTPFKCKECGKEFKYASSLRVHYHTHFPEEPKLHKCDLCDYRSNYKANLHKHHKNVHAAKDSQIQCPDCGKTFTSGDNMRRHRKIHTMTRPFSCEICKKSFKSSSSLKGHQLIHTKTRPFTCNIPGCNRSFRTAKFMKSHQEEYHRLVPKKFSCQVEGCNYSFFKRSHLKRHAITHTGERNYHCAWPGCRKSFRHADNLKVHFRNHSMETLQCHMCDFKCKQPISLVKHKKNAHKVFGPTIGSFTKLVDKKVITDKTVKEAEQEGDDLATGNVGEEGSHATQAVVNEGETNDLLNSSSFSKLANLEKSASVKKSSAGSMDLYEFKSDGESEEEGPSPLRWDSVKSTAPVVPLPPPPKELLLKNEKLEKKEKDKLEKAEKRELLKKEKADKKEQEKKEKLDKKEQEKKEKLEKKEQEKKDKEEKREQEKRDRKEQKEKEKKEKEEMKEKEKKEKGEQKEREKLEKEQQKEKERKEKEEQREKERLKKKEEKDEQREKEKLKKKEEKDEQREKEKLKKKEEKEKEKSEKLARKVKLKKEKERKKMEVKRLKSDAKKLLQRRTTKLGRGASRKASLLAMKAKAAKGKKGILGKRKPSSRAASPRNREEKKPIKGRKKVVDNESADTAVLDNRKKKGKASSKPQLSEDKEKPASRSASPRAASPRGATGIKSPKGDTKAASPRAVTAHKSHKADTKAASPRAVTGNKSPKGDTKASVGKRGKKKGALPRRKPSARIKASQKTQQKTTKNDAATSKKNVKGVAKKVVAKVVRRGRWPKKQQDVESGEGENESEEAENESGEAENESGEAKSESGEVNDKKNVGKDDGEDKVEESSKEGDVVSDKVIEVNDRKSKKVLNETKIRLLSKPSSPTPSSSEEESDMLQGNASPYRDFSDAEDLDEEQKEEEVSEKIQSEPGSIESSREDEQLQTQSESPNRVSEIEENAVGSGKSEEVVQSKDDDDDRDIETYHAEESSDDDEGINDIPLTPPRAPAPPPVLSSEDELDLPDDDAIDSAPYSTPAPNTPYSTPAPNTPFSVPGPTTPFSVPPATNLMQQHSVHSSEEMAPGGISSVASLDLPSAGSVEMPQGSVESTHQIGSVEMQHRNSSEMSQHSDMIHHRNSTEMPQHGSVEMQHPHSVEMHPHASVEMHTSHQNSTEMQQHAHAPPPVDLPNHDLINMHHSAPVSEMHGPHPGVDNLHQHPNASPNMVHSHPASLDTSNHHPMEEISHPVPQSLTHASVHTPPPHQLDKFMHTAPGVIEDSEANASSEADKRCFDQYLRNLSAANNEAAAAAARNGGNLLVGSPDTSRDAAIKSPINVLQQSSIATSVIANMDTTAPSLYPGQADLRRLEAMVGERQPPHADSLYTARDTMSAALGRQNTSTPLLPTNHATPTPSYEAFPSLNPLHSSTARDNATASSYLRQPENHLFATPPVTSSFMAEAMFQRQSMTTPFLPPQPTDRNALASRIPDPTASLRSNNTSSLLRRPSTMPATADMFATPTVPQAVPRHPLSNSWPGQEVRPATHWQNPYFPRQTNMASAAAATNNPFFPAKENYLPGRDFMFDPSVHRSQTERSMFPSLAASSQSQDSLQLDRFNLSNFFPNPVTPYGSSSSSLDYSRPPHSANPKPFDDRYRQSAATAGLPDFRGLPTPTSAATDRFAGIPGVNTGFNLYPTNHSMAPYHTQHMTADNMNSAFLTHHPSTAQHAMLERDYAAAAAHRGLYPHQNPTTPYPFIDERQYSGTSGKLSHGHATPSAVTAPDRDIMSRTATQDTQMQDTYRSMLYRY